MGAPNSPHEDITENVFFNEIDWKKLERRSLEPPFKPQVVSTKILICSEQKEIIYKTKNIRPTETPPRYTVFR